MKKTLIIPTEIDWAKTYSHLNWIEDTGGEIDKPAILQIMSLMAYGAAVERELARRCPGEYVERWQGEGE